MISLDQYLKLVPKVQSIPDGSFWVHFDAEADTLYVNFRRPSVAVDSDLTDDDVIVRYDAQDAIVGFTVLNVTQRLQA